MSAMPIEPFVSAEHRDRRLLRATVWCSEFGEQEAMVRTVSRNGLG